MQSALATCKKFVARISKNKKFLVTPPRDSHAALGPTPRHPPDGPQPKSIRSRRTRWTFWPVGNVGHAKPIRWRGVQEQLVSIVTSPAEIY